MYSFHRDGELLIQKAKRVFGKYMPDALFENVPEPQKQRFTEVVDGNYGEPIVVFHEKGELRTTLTQRYLVSFAGNEVWALPLTSVRQGYDVKGNHEGIERKEEQNWIRFPDSSIWFWTPSAQHLSLLLNSMFIVFERNEQTSRSE